MTDKTEKPIFDKSGKVTKLDNGVAYERGDALVLASISLKKFALGDELPFVVLADIVEKAETDKDDAPVIDKDGKPSILHILKITDLRTGEDGEIVAPYMVRKGLLEAGEYVGKAFVAVKGEKKGRTDMWAVYPITIK